MPSGGVYKVAAGGDVMVGRQERVTLALMDGDDNSPVASAVGATSLGASSDGDIVLPVGFMTYREFSAGDAVLPVLMSATGRQGRQLMAGGYLTMEKIPGKKNLLSRNSDFFFNRYPLSDGSEYISCTNDGVISQKVIGYTACASNSASFESAMDPETGVFVAPEAGEYEVSFTGLLASRGGRRVWATLYRLEPEDEGKDDPRVAGASFVGMFAEDAATGDRLAEADLASSTTLVSVERLERGQKVRQQIFPTPVSQMWFFFRAVYRSAWAWAGGAPPTRSRGTT